MALHPTGKEQQQGELPLRCLEPLGACWMASDNHMGHVLQWPPLPSTQEPPSALHHSCGRSSRRGSYLGLPSKPRRPWAQTKGNIPFVDCCIFIDDVPPHVWIYLEVHFDAYLETKEES